MNPSSRRDFLRQSAAAVSATGVCGYTDLFALTSSAEPLTEVTADNGWFADSPFNLLVDYYTEIPFRPYGSAPRQKTCCRCYAS